MKYLRKLAARVVLLHFIFFPIMLHGAPTEWPFFGVVAYAAAVYVAVDFFEWIGA